MMFIVMMYSAAIPCLYPAGFALMVISYWQDKIMFLRHYRIPPRYGRALAARVVKILEVGIILHLFFGLYMLSNPDIFTYEDEKISAPGWMQEFTKLFAQGAVNLLGEEYEDRFSQVHTVIYCFGISIFLVLFLLEKVFGAIEKLLGKCFRFFDDKEKEQEFSTDIYSELTPNQQFNEYQATNTAIKHIEYRIEKGDSNNPELYKYFRERLMYKRQIISYQA